MKLLKSFLFLVCVLFVSSLLSRNILLEFKGAYFLPTGTSFKNIYKGNALFGPELTVQLCQEKNWYAFASFDYLKTHGHSTSLCDSTSVQLFPVALGFKYLLDELCENVEFYAGLGFEAMNVRTKNCSPYVKQKISKWGLGGIAKAGAYCYLPHNFLIDIFVDCSFIRAGSSQCYCPDSGVQAKKANIGGAIFGVALGYTFE